MSYVLTLTAHGSGHSVSAPLNAVVPTPTEGGGGWEEVALPKRGAVLIWKGRGLLKLKLGIVFDATHPVGAAHQVLRHMYRPEKPEDVPPVLSVSCDGDVVPFLDDISEWVLTDLEWSEAIADEQGERVQQGFTLTLTEYRPDEHLLTVEEAKNKDTKHRHRITAADLKHGIGGLAEKHYKRKGLGLALALVQRPPRTDTRLTKKDIGKWIIFPDKLEAKGDTIIESWQQTVTAG